MTQKMTPPQDLAAVSIFYKVILFYKVIFFIRAIFIQGSLFLRCDYGITLQVWSRGRSGSIPPSPLYF